jgi:hypothetical protein
MGNTTAKGGPLGRDTYHIQVMTSERLPLKTEKYEGFD